MTDAQATPTLVERAGVMVTTESVSNREWNELVTELLAALTAATARAEEAEADVRAVIELGQRFGFQEKHYSVGQVITHAEYLQQQRARLLYADTVTWPARLAALEAALKARSRGIKAIAVYLLEWGATPAFYAMVDTAVYAIELDELSALPDAGKEGTP